LTPEVAPRVFSMKNSTVRARPSSKPTFGSQPSSRRASSQLRQLRRCSPAFASPCRASTPASVSSLIRAKTAFTSVSVAVPTL
jgi:hypothetical protein